MDGRVKDREIGGGDFMGEKSNREGGDEVGKGE